MKIRFWIHAVVFHYAVRTVFSNCIQVGTALFTTTDLVKKCWSESDKALLRARLIMQDVLPDPDCIDFSKPDAVLTLIDYFQSCYDIIGVSTYGNVQNLMYRALSDAIGGYLRGYALPLTKRAYYEGAPRNDKENIRETHRNLAGTQTESETPDTYISIENGLNDEEKNGGLIRASKYAKEMTDQTEKRGRNFTDSFKMSAKVEKRKCKFEQSDCQCPDGSRYNKIIVPLPVLEDCGILHTIAVPFKVRPLRNVQTRKSAFVLEHYYITVLKCLLSKCSAQKDIKSFNAQFHKWLVTQVFPHLSDEQWYPAFGGIYRITETIRKLGAESTIKEFGSHDIGFIFTKGFEFEDEEECERTGKEKIRDVGEEEFGGGEKDPKPKRYFLYAVAVLGIVWVCALCACISYCCAHGCWRQNSTHVMSHSSRDNNADEKLVNFHFLVKFFKSKGLRNSATNAPNFEYEFSKKQFQKERGDYMCNNTRKGSEYEMKESERAEEKESIGNFKKMAVLEHGGCPPFLSVEDEQTKQFLKPVFPSVWPYQSSFIQFDKERLMPKPANKSMNPTGGKNITRPREWETISKKPSNPHLGREMKFGKLPSSTSSNTGTSTSPSINTSTFSREQTNEGIKTSETDSKRGTRVTDSVDDG
ncbi:hypothetical protein RUM44_005353 [Polyplax serrata]|uniref:Uncharacterized protein n=1 Tax=Polyplax serrata TaxID=468196 RepID=A0ABR1ADB3_POLSC